MSAVRPEEGLRDPGYAEHRGPLSSRELRRREEEVAEWSGVLLAALQSTAQRPRGVEAGVEESAGWRHPVGILTPGDTTTNSRHETAETHGASTDDTLDGEPNQVRLEVNVGRLGTIAVSVERGADGLRLLLGAVERSTARLLESECQALVQALALGGLRVESIRFVTLSGDGPDVASARSAASKRFTKKATSESEGSAAEKRKTKRLNLVG